MSKVRYEIVEGIGFTEFEKDVMEKLNDGWERFGEFQVIVLPGDEKYGDPEAQIRLYQGFTKTILGAV